MRILRSSTARQLGSLACLKSIGVRLALAAGILIGAFAPMPASADWGQDALKIGGIETGAVGIGYLILQHDTLNAAANLGSPQYPALLEKLDEAIVRHPDIGIATVAKELHYFASLAPGNAARALQVWHDIGSGPDSVADQKAAGESASPAYETSLSPAESSENVITPTPAQLEAAHNLGVDLHSITVVNGVAQIRIGYAGSLSPSDIDEIRSYAQSLGATSVEVDSGYIANERLDNTLSYLASSGKRFNGGTVTINPEAKGDYLINFPAYSK